MSRNRCGERLFFKRPLGALSTASLVWYWPWLEAKFVRQYKAMHSFFGSVTGTITALTSAD
jgi:hypothetical protein